MKDIRRQQLGLVPGVALAAALPGITLDETGTSPLFGYIFAFILFAGISTAVWATPKDPHQGVLLPILAVVGLTQDTLVWYLIAWLSEVRLNSVWWALAGAFVVRGCCWAAVWTLPSGTPGTPPDGTSET
ncbi:MULTISPECIES: hypothetical protein [unclassified Streptomyces]|uniref:hypothetical protein n=1 Tax=unclassified Streptomyces TaxID=2593676 RepID=UPI00336A4884